MIDTRMKVDGKWNFSMDNVWYVFIMLVCSVWIALELLASYALYTATGELKIGIMMIITIMVMNLATTRRQVDRLIAKIKVMESGK